MHADIKKITSSLPLLNIEKFLHILVVIVGAAVADALFKSNFSFSLPYLLDSFTATSSFIQVDNKNCKHITAADNGVIRHFFFWGDRSFAVFYYYYYFNLFTMKLTIYALFCYIYIFYFCRLLHSNTKLLYLFTYLNR